MEYLLLAAVVIWMLSIVIGNPLWTKYTAWIEKNFVEKKKE